MTSVRDRVALMQSVSPVTGDSRGKVRDSVTIPTGCVTKVLQSGIFAQKKVTVYVGSVNMGVIGRLVCTGDTVGIVEVLVLEQPTIETVDIIPVEIKILGSQSVVTEKALYVQELVGAYCVSGSVMCGCKVCGYRPCRRRCVGHNRGRPPDAKCIGLWRGRGRVKRGVG